MTATLELYGTLTSPFVRRVRIVCLERSIPFTMVNTAVDEGQAALRRVSPIWKVPVAVFDDGRVVYDSRVIVDELCRDSWAPLRPPSLDIRGRADEENVITMVDDATLALVRRFYLQKDGAPVDAPYLEKDHARALATMKALEDQLPSSSSSSSSSSLMVGAATARGGVEGGFGRAELALVTALDWMDFRQTFDLTTTPKLNALRTHWNEAMASVASTKPPA